MATFDPATLPLVVHVLVFTVAAALTWLVGGRLAVYADALAERTRFGHALLGALLLGGVASLPELTMSATAAAGGDAALSITTLLGGIPVTLAMVAICDVFAGPRPVSSKVTQPTVLLQGALLICLLSLLATGIVAGDRAFLHAGVGSLLLGGIYLGMVAGMHRLEQARPRWNAAGDAAERGPAPTPPRVTLTMPGLILRTAAASFVIVSTGCALAITASGIARATDIGSSLIGMVLGGIATSFPELTTIYAAIRIGRYELAFADAFGSDLMSVGLVYVADLAYPGSPILNHADRAALIAALLGIASTAIYLTGLIQRARPVWKLGLDSVLALCAYGLGLALMYAVSR